MIKRERVKNLLTNRLKILKDILISESYAPAQNITGLFVAAIEKWIIPRRIQLRRASPEETVGATAFAMKTHKKGIYA